MVFHWSLSDNKSPQVFRTLLSILAVLSNADIWIVSTRPPTSKSSRPFYNPLVIVPKASIKTGTFVTFMFHCFFNSLARSRYLSSFSHFQFYSVVGWDSKVDNFPNSLIFSFLLAFDIITIIHNHCPNISCQYQKHYSFADVFVTFFSFFHVDILRLCTTTLYY